MLRRWRTEIVAFAVAIALGVGVALVFGVGRASEEGRVRDVATFYLDAFAEGSPEGVCSAVSPLARASYAFSSTDCESSAKTAIAKVPHKQRVALHKAKITVVSVNDAEAEVQFSPKLSGTGDMHLVKRNDTWFVNP